MAEPWPDEAQTGRSRQGPGPGACQRNGVNRSTRPTVPSSGLATCRAFDQARLHDQRVLSGVVVVPAAPADHTEPERFVEGERFGVAGPDLEDDEADRALTGVVEHTSEQGARDPAAAAIGMNGDVRDVELVGDFPQTDVPGHAAAVPNDEATRQLVALH